jgi:hypothetical protein
LADHAHGQVIVAPRGQLHAADDHRLRLRLRRDGWRGVPDADPEQLEGDDRKYRFDVAIHSHDQILRQPPWGDRATRGERLGIF